MWNSHLTITFGLSNIPALYNQYTTIWQPVESYGVVLSDKDSFRLMETCRQSVCIYELNRNYFHTFDNLSEGLQSVQVRLELFAETLPLAIKSCCEDLTLSRSKQPFTHHKMQNVKKGQFLKMYWRSYFVVVWLKVALSNQVCPVLDGFSVNFN